jgi:hypothetical protein
MKDQATIDQFIALRAQGWSYDRIAQSLNVSKPTLIDWGRQHQFTIQNLRTIEMEALAEQCFANRRQRWEQLGAALRRVEGELATRDLRDVPTARLLTLASTLRDEAARETAPLRFSTPVRDIPSEQQIQNVMDWQL